MTDTPTDEQETGRVRPFADVLQEINGGRAAGAASQQLHDLIAAVRETGKGGSITLQIGVKPAAKGNGSTVLVAAVVKAKTPQPEVAASVFFVTDDDNLSRENPEQPQLPLRAAEPTRPALRSAQK